MRSRPNRRRHSRQETVSNLTRMTTALEWRLTGRTAILLMLDMKSTEQAFR